ncbi:RNA polymerase sigma factor [Glacieibacterium sp.]|uniref:RNA polymerase sigma factor n=1 Tax=Glacieibacterium sp. TaxID=2860237 RepID=UPI003B005FBD
MNFEALTDGELATLALAGRDRAFAEIMQRHRGALYRIVVGNVGDPDEALDLVQESFLSAHRALSRYDETRSMRGWLATIAVNKCRDWGRRRAVRRVFAFARRIDDVAEQVPIDLPGQDVTTADRQDLAKVAHAVTELPEKLRETLVLRAIEGLSQAEVAAILGISDKAVETRLYRARAALSRAVGRGPDGPAAYPA